jgi:GTPase
VVIALNKADLLGGTGAGKSLMQATRDQFHFLSYAPMVLISALRGDGVADLMTTIDKVAAQFYRRVTTAELNRFFAEVCETHPPPIHRGRSVRINYLTQGGVAPPTFIMWASRPEGLSPSYRRFVQNRLRARYGFEGTPLRLIVKAKQRRPSRRSRR